MSEEQLVWIPLYIDSLLSSKRWRFMRDFERGWYISLIVESVRSERRGYLRLDENLWRFAGANSRQAFEGPDDKSHAGTPRNVSVLACFKHQRIDGQVWIYSERLVRTLEEQAVKRRRKTDPSNSISNSQEENRESEEKLCDNTCAKCRGRGMLDVLQPSKLQPGTSIRVWKECECQSQKAAASP